MSTKRDNYTGNMGQTHTTQLQRYFFTFSFLFMDGGKAYLQREEEREHKL